MKLFLTTVIAWVAVIASPVNAQSPSEKLDKLKPEPQFFEMESCKVESARGEDLSETFDAYIGFSTTEKDKALVVVRLKHPGVVVTKFRVRSGRRDLNPSNGFGGTIFGNCPAAITWKCPHAEEVAKSIGWEHLPEGPVKEKARLNPLIVVVDSQILKK